MRTNSLTKNRVADAVDLIEEPTVESPRRRKPQRTTVAAPEMRSEVRISLDAIELHEMTVRIVGTAPLVVHRFGAKPQLDLANNVGLPGSLRKPNEKRQRQPKNAVADFLDTLYVPERDDVIEGYGRDGKKLDWYMPEKVDEGLHPVWARFVGPAAKRGAHFVFPAHAIREAIGSAAFATGVTKDIISLRRAIHVARIMLPIETPHAPQMLYMIADVQGKPDLRFRALFGGPAFERTEWAVTAVLRYFTAIVSDETVLNLLNAAGVVAGIGEMRAEKKIGTYGSFRIDRESVRIENMRQ